MQERERNKETVDVGLLSSNTEWDYGYIVFR